MKTQQEYFAVLAAAFVRGKKAFSRS